MSIHLCQKTIYGKKIRTNNKSTNEIVQLWQQADQLDLRGDIYAIYSNYKSNYDEEYDLLIGNEHNNSQESQIIYDGNYLEITVSEATPEGVYKAWQRIWSDFELEKQRQYKTDFEFYKEDGTVSIFLSVNL